MQAQDVMTTVVATISADATVQEAAKLMLELLVIALPGFEWLTLKGFTIGLVKSFLYGALLGLVYVPIYNTLARRFGS